MRMLEWIIHQKVLMMLVSVFIIGIGIYSISHLDTELTPEVSLDGASITVEASNMSVEDVERQITIPLEQQLQKIVGLDEVTSTTSTGESSLHVTFANGKGDQLYQAVESNVHFLMSDIPNVDQVNVQQDGATAAFEFILDLSNGDIAEMTDFAKNTLQPRLEKLPEVQEVMVAGLREQKVIIEWNDDALENHGVTTGDVIGQIQQTNAAETIGDVTSVEVYWDTTFENVDAIQKLPISTDQGDATLNDIAEVSLETEDATADTWKNGSSDVLMVQIARAENVSQKAMTTAVRDEISKIKSAGLGTDMTLNEVIAHADFVDDAMGDVTKNIVIGGIIAIVMLLLFLRNIRATVVISVSIPTSILLTVLAMHVLDYSMNLLTLIGLGLGIGMMVDSSIVILEAIYRKKEQGLSSVAAVIEGTKEVATAITASALTTIVVFLPIGLIGGDSGKYMLILAIVVAITLISSVLIAFTLIPTLAKDFLRYKKARDNAGPGRIVAFYKKVLLWCLEKKRRSLLIVVSFLLVFTFSFFLIPKIPLNIMPDIFNRYTEVAIDLENDVSEEEKLAIIEQVNEQLQQIDDVEANFLLDYDDRFMASIVMTKGNDVTKEQELVTEEIIASLRDLQKTEPIRAVERALDGVSGYPVQIELAGEDFNELQAATKELQTEIRAIDGVVGITSDMDNYSTRQKVSIDEDAIEEAGLTPLQMKDQLSAFLSDEAISIVEWDETKIPIYAKSSTSENVLNETIPTMNGKEELATFISLKTEKTPNQIVRKNGKRYLSIMADVEGADLGTVNKSVQDVLNRFDNEETYSVSLAGDLEEQQDLMNDMLLAMAIAIFLVYVVMAVQFNHFGHPLIVMATLPITVVGVILGLFLTQAELNMMSGMGIIILIGIVLNNAILLIDRTKQLRKDGVPIVPSLIQAGEQRMRPIFMTTLTTIGGMLPLALATGMSADYQAPMAIVIISGLLFSTIITLILIPAIYRLCSRG